jgi:small conductance mechanosensitive channel
MIARLQQGAPTADAAAAPNSAASPDTVMAPDTAAALPDTATSPDTAAALPDTAMAPDTAAALPDTATSPDTAGAIQEIAESVGETGRLLASGDLGSVWDTLITDGVTMVVTFVPNVLSALFVGVVFFGIYRVLYRLSEQVLHRSRRVHAGLQSIALRTLRVAGLGLVALMVLAQLGVNVTAIVAGLGITGLALGFAAKDTLENFISGVTILLDKPFKVGDTIRIEDVYGTVDDISLRSTRVRTLANRVLVMPNTLMINQKLINYSRERLLRIDVDFGIAYKEKIDEARQIVLDTLKGDDRILKSPEPRIVVTELNSSSVDMQLRMFVNDATLEYPLRFEYLETVREALRSADIEIPYPHLQLFIDEAKALSESSPSHEIATAS